ncbi:NAD(P)-dependent dehydrogenase (short-subunit alcohol dehydrogenase family) [Pseudochelatococcus lubricantis]|uniref:NAD(P)-dependent dehydrogenase (Short-subunit alcohol dehydrogenase family) n=1 Tax=Pseudochelatococcus lubricantis TaxID=1538102 RepID=A0ABX0UZ07_9HYPH|nr:SDR family oxidoreductase [Pseudochelatococcus lubricantis]NIJ58187.1 NAD(P)-dependent dehydrogenase (short-subunit alcohol dehydrogenase family) [Pseudochelatococcus lubricantis]
MTTGVALVTGGTRRIGRAISRRLAAAGYAVAIHYRHSAAEADSLAAEIAGGGGRAATLHADLADAGAVATLVPHATERLGPVTLLVNSASIFEPDAIADLGLDLWEETFAVNLRAPMLLARDMAAGVPEGRYGAIVNILDQRVLRPNPQFFSYTLTKSALATATRTMAQALAPRIRVNGVAPGPTCAGARQTAEDFARQAAATLLGRGPSPGEIADAVLYLAGAASVTGQVLAVDGGQHLLWRTADVDGIPE